MHAPAIAHGKRPLLASAPILKAILDAIRDARSILVTAHARPDGDAVGSVLACGMMLEQLGKQVTMVFSDRVPLIYRWLPCAQSIQHWQQVEGDFGSHHPPRMRWRRTQLASEGAGGSPSHQHRSPHQRAQLRAPQLDRHRCLRRCRAGLHSGMRRRRAHHAGDGHLPLHGFAHGHRLLLL